MFCIELHLADYLSEFLPRDCIKYKKYGSLTIEQNQDREEDRSASQPHAAPSVEACQGT
jgi:hypothetical protein